jgi:hypothetical protein
MVRKAVYWALNKRPSLSPKSLEGATVVFDDNVRWFSAWSESQLGFSTSVFGGNPLERVKLEVVIDENNALFWAYAKARMRVEAVIKNVTLVQRSVGCPYFAFDVNAIVTISDIYEFPDGGRNWILQYQAANHLETKAGYRVFSHSVTFSKEYTGLRSVGPGNVVNVSKLHNY